MKIATVLFTFNRPKHTHAVLEALRKNSELPDKLFVFHDGYKDGKNLSEWDEVTKVITQIDWCEHEIITATKNKGLANSIIDGVNHAFKSYDAVIVLEDDCVPHRLFMEYMILALEKYKNNPKVYCIGASSEPVMVPSNGCDAYFMGRINSCGWATWNDRWKHFSRDYRLIGDIKKNPELKEWLDIWGQDIEPMIIGDALGNVDTWASFWALSVIKKKGLCLAPYKSFIDNIGYDGSGIHSGGEKPDFIYVDENKKEIVLPDEVEIIADYQNVFADYYPWTEPSIRELYYKNVLLKWLDLEQQHYDYKKWFETHRISKACIWGMGAIGNKLLNLLENIVEVLAIIESHPKSDEIKGMRCVHPDNIPENADCIIVVPGYDMKRIARMVDEKTSKKLISIDEFFESMA
ncbi:glycosyltransferase family 2 protein [Butyrivibrio sp. VCB2006]|uniref:glycosyltransferase family 2 protein n=1 Tax=Butyrivibrio sp. VCB2006 TaxID=1280679 RepID=UPI00040A98A6|nr:glycosyltransferase [Butyrivibrio sp. VCB2006]